MGDDVEQKAMPVRRLLEVEATDCCMKWSEKRPFSPLLLSLPNLISSAIFPSLIPSFHPSSNPRNPCKNLKSYVKPILGFE